MVCRDVGTVCNHYGGDSENVIHRDAMLTSYQLLKEISSPSTVVRPAHTRTLSTPGLRVGERQPLLRRRSLDEFDAGSDDIPPATPVAGGTILGVHNLAIVMPQFIVSLAASIIFRVVDKQVDGDPMNDNVYFGKNGVVWVLRFGGLCTLFGYVILALFF